MQKLILYLLTVCVIFTQTSLVAQVKSYDAKGKPTASRSDFLNYVELPEPQRVAAGAIIAALAGTGMQIYSTIKEKKQLTYTGVYSNTFSLDAVPKKKFRLSRLLIDDTEEQGTFKYIGKQTASEFDFTIQKNNATGIKISLDKVLLKLSKACSRGNQRLGINIEMTLWYIDKDQAMAELGTSSVIVPIIYVRNTPFDLTGSDISDFIKPAEFGPIPTDAASKAIILGVKITEVNISKVDPTLIEMIMKNNGDSIKDTLAEIQKKEE